MSMELPVYSIPLNDPALLWMQETSHHLPPRLQVGMECSKYGGVQSVLIFEVLEPGFNPEEAVRIFVKFGRIEDATKALVDLNGRFFGGRTVSACFFDEDRFDMQDLAPKPGE